MITDPIADLLIRIRNASSAGREKLSMPYSKIKAAILEILKKEDIIDDLSEKAVHGKRMLEVSLTPPGRKRIMPDFVRVSTPGRRVYVKAKNIPRPLKGYGLVLISTSQGIMTGQQARDKGIGGEILFKEK